MSKTITVTEAARNFSEVVNQVFYRGESMELTRGGKVVARLIPATEAEPPTGQQVREAWRTAIPHLTKEEADAFADDLEQGRDALNQFPASRWE
jgi:prevent-host-death family protein